MQIILLSDFCRKRGSLDLCPSSAAMWVVSAVLVLVGLGVWTGVWLGAELAEQRQTEVATKVISRLLDQERYATDDMRLAIDAEMDTMARQVARLQAEMVRLEALGSRLVELGKLNAKEFDFSVEPALGGVSEDGKPVGDAELNLAVARLTESLDDRARKLELLEGVLMSGDLMETILPSGRPIETGWISSTYGSRIDPFTGKKTAHHGMDFAAEKGTEIKAVAAGLVVRSEATAGYGNLVEILHADGLSTRYAHNQKNMVEFGELVEKGQVIALLGSTGRSSGPHVHFEVRQDGRPRNPYSFVKKK